MELDDIYLLLWNIKGIGYKTIKKIEDYFNGIENFWGSNVSEIYKIPNISSKVKENIVKYKSLGYLEEIKKNLEKESITHIGINNPKYPDKLKNIYDPPYVLFVKGNANVLNEFSIAMVGSRKASTYGIWCAKKISEELSNLDINIVSGMALGIDYYSHLGCLNGKGKTIAVLGCSIDKPYPKENIKLMNKIIENNGAIVSEYILGTSPKPGYFPMRNRIISGISDGVVIVEAGERSGSLITMDYALEQGKNIFSVPGNINSYMSKGTNKIIKEGAKLVTCVEDILDEYNICYKSSDSGNLKRQVDLSQDEIAIVDILRKYGSLYVDFISKYSNLNIKHVLGILNILEIKGIVMDLGNKIYNINEQYY